MKAGIDFDLVSGGQITIFVGSATLTVLKNTDGTVNVLDGLHNNGGWKVAHTYAEVIAKIKAA